jgi:CRP-like cAMP-binding protein
MLFGKKKKNRHYATPSEALADGRGDTAVAMYRELARAEPAKAPNWHKKAAEVLASMGRPEDAVEEYLTAITGFEVQDRMVQVVALLKAALRVAPDDPRVQTKLDEIAAQESELAAASSQDPGSMTIRTRLRRYAPLFSEFSREELSGIVDVMRSHQLPSGATIFEQGDEGDSIFIVALGEVALTVHSRRAGETEQREIDRLQEGACFGEISALSRAPRNVTAMTTRETELLELQRDYLEALAIAHPHIWTVLERFQKERRIPAGV